MPMKDPPHPGMAIRHDCLEPLGLSVTAAAHRLGVSRKQLSSIVNCRSGISPDMAIRLDKAFGGGVATWYWMQAAYDMAQAASRADSIVVEPVLVVATTILGSNGDDDGNPGDWYDGELCQHAFWFNRFWYPRYFMDGGVEMHCNKTDPLYPNGKVERWSKDGVAEFPRLLHTKYFNETRRIRFFVTYNGVTSNITTNPIRIDSESIHFLN